MPNPMGVSGGNQNKSVGHFGRCRKKMAICHNQALIMPNP
jgi:hypothetical protein